MSISLKVAMIWPHYFIRVARISSKNDKGYFIFTTIYDAQSYGCLQKIALNPKQCES